MKASIALSLTGIALLLGLGAVKVSPLARVATGFVTQEVCSGTFISGLPPEQIFSQTAAAMPGVGAVRSSLHFEVDQEKQEVTTTFLGQARSRAVFQEGRGCTLIYDQRQPTPLTLAAQPTGAEAPLITASNPKLRQAIEGAFTESGSLPRATHAVVVMQNGKVIGEQYAPGYTIQTPIHGFSATKSFTSALIGLLVTQHKLTLNGPLPIAQNPHPAITVEQLLRHTSGLDMGDSLGSSLANVFDRVNQMKFAEADMAGFALASKLKTAPGTSWQYHDGNYLILSRLIRDATGGTPEGVMQFASSELFDPLGMHSVTIEFDATGTPNGASQMFASARDWAKFGQLYLNDGVVQGKRLLTSEWIAYTLTPTPNAWVGMGAGFWVNSDHSRGANQRVQEGMPQEAYMARGAFGQYLVMVPSKQLVIARFGTSGQSGDEAGVARLVADVMKAVTE